MQLIPMYSLGLLVVETTKRTSGLSFSFSKQRYWNPSMVVSSGSSMKSKGAESGSSFFVEALLMGLSWQGRNDLVTPLFMVILRMLCLRSVVSTKPFQLLHWSTKNKIGPNSIMMRHELNCCNESRQPSPSKGRRFGPLLQRGKSDAASRGEQVCGTRSECREVEPRLKRTQQNGALWHKSRFSNYYSYPQHLWMRSVLGRKILTYQEATQLPSSGSTDIGGIRRSLINLCLDKLVPSASEEIDRLFFMNLSNEVLA